MARSNAFSVKIDVSQLVDLSDKLAGLTPERVGELLVDSINATADSAYELSRKAILSGINLTDAYVQQRMAVEHATAKKPEASIIAFGDKENLTALSHYGAIQRLQSAHTKRSKGDPARGIPAGMKTDGISVAVAQGNRKPLKSSRVFIAPNKLDLEGNPFVFQRLEGTTRSGKDKLKRLMGPSVYQLFRVAGALIENQVYGDLERAVIDAAEQQFAKELS